MTPKTRIVLIVSCLFAVVGVACLIAGIVLLHKTCDKPGVSGTGSTSSQDAACSYSEEAQRVGLPEFLQRVQDTFYDLHPEKIEMKPKVKTSEVVKKFRSYDPSPANLKKTTDKSFDLFKEIKDKKVVKHKLKPRERKALAQIIHFLQHVFGTPYDGNYYNGDYLLGPNFFCWHAICNVRRSFGTIGRFFKPSSTEEVKLLLDKIKTFNHTFSQYQENLMYGAKAGMVRSIDECKAGVQVFTARFPDMNEPKDVFNISFTSDNVLSKLSKEEKEKWFNKNKKSVSDEINDHVVQYIGKPLHELITYLKTTYLEHCVPSNISSGLSGLPLSHVYVNGTRTNQSTHSFLPSGERLNGSKAYEYIMSYFTTTDVTPDKVHELGLEMIDKLYSQVLELVRNETQTTNTTEAKAKFLLKLNDSEMYYQNENIPEIESNGTAHGRCSGPESAKKYCPIRWKTIQRWFKDAYKIMSLLDSKTVNMFYFTGSKHTTPNCPIRVAANFNPAMGVASYRASGSRCRVPAVYKIPFFVSRPGPKFSQWSVNAHEARPGHHTQVQGLEEHFRDSCGGVIHWLDYITSYTAFVEGWGLYAEFPLIGKDTDVYDDNPIYKYGGLRSMIFRAIRLVVDTGLHYKGFSRQKARQYFDEYVWLTSDVVPKEITRYQSNPGQAVAYMVGQRHLIKLREHAQNELGSAFILKDFHYHLLKHGSAPLSYLTESIDEYIRCTKNKNDVGCEFVLTREGTGKPKPSDYVTNIDRDFLPDYVVERYY